MCPSRPSTVWFMHVGVDDQAHAASSAPCPVAGVREEAAKLGDAQWGRLAQFRLPGRSGTDCRLRWLNVECANRAEWAAKEDGQLMRLAEKHDGHKVAHAPPGRVVACLTSVRTEPCPVS